MPEVARYARRATLLLAATWSLDAAAQMPQAPQPLPPIPAVPQTMPLPATLPGQPAMFDPNNPGAASPRFLFAGALAMVAKSVGATVVSSLSQGIVNWFNSSGTGAQSAANPWMAPPPMMGGYPGAMPPPPPMGFPTPMSGAQPPPMGFPAPMPGAMPPGAMPPGTMLPGAMPPGAMPPGGLPPPYMPPASAGAPGLPAAPFPATAAPMPGAPMTAAALPMTPAPAFGSAPAPAPTLYAGIAFEVHLLGAGGSETTVDPGAYVFHSGDRFLVYYRPSLPGRVHVSNVSPTGAVIPIETLTLAGAQLAKLGPYQLTDPAGDEALRLVLEPCSSPELVAATRNIVKATDSGSGTDLTLGSCQTSTVAAAGVGTRNIVKTTMDGNTGFALDPVNSQELASGHLLPRETTIAIHHR